VKKAMVGLLFFLTFLMIGCVSIPEPDANSQTLVIGEIVLEERGSRNTQNNGIFTNVMKITIQEISSGKLFTTRIQGNGLLFITNIPQGRYRVTKISRIYPPSGNSDWNRGDVFEVVYGAVSNLGVVNVYWNWGTQVYTITANKEYDQVRNDFQRGNRSSNWNEKQWINVSMRW